MHRAILCLAAVAVALAAPTTPPVITLDLAAASGLSKLANSALLVHDLGITQPDGTPVGSRQDYVQRCQVDATTCPLPKANAFDHQDGKLAVTVRVFKVDQDGTKMNTQIKESQINYKQRSSYYLKYDAADSSGNHAEQIVFGLIIEDTTAPVITPCIANTESVEAASNWKLCGNTKAVDNVDGDVAKTLRYTVVYKGAAVCTRCSHVKASAAISSMKLGAYKVTAFAHDSAGLYGHAGKNNAAQATFTVIVKDTLPPIISQIGANPATHECATPYSDEGALAVDKYDKKAGKTVRVTTKSTINNKKVGSYKVTYSAKDSNSNEAAPKSRSVNVVDTTKPKIWLKGSKRLEHHSETAFSDPGVACSDSCSKYTIKAPVWKTPFTDTKLADYLRTYTCVDAMGNKASVSRTFTVVDSKAPTLTVTGKPTVTVEAGGTYTEQGAKCRDYVDGDLSKNIKITGKVNVAKAGSYTVTYNCADNSGNSAPFMQRTVVVKDTTCPTITVLGKTAIKIEAGFEYKDAGATASDSFDGDLTSKITTDGDTVDTNKAFFARKSCQEIKKNFKEATSGRYFITVAGKRVAVWCNMGKTVGTFMPCDKCSRVVPYGKAQGDCGKFGMKMADFPNHRHKLAVAKSVRAHFTEPKEEESKYFPTNPKATTNYYVCVLEKTPSFKVGHAIKHSEIAHAEQGKYIVSYHVQDAAGNKECKPARRTVVVGDTLAPVITLHYHGKLVHASASNDKGLNGQANTAGTAAGNPFIGEIGLQEEQTTSVASGWASIVAVSFGVGVALLAFSGNSKTATSVPV